MHIAITGASSGIGREIALAFDKPGNQLSLVARRKPLLEELERQVTAPTQAIDADLADARDPTGWIERAEQAFGPIDVLVNNAGMSYVEPANSVDAARVEKLFQVNVHAPIAAIHRVLRAMIARDRGAIINVASIAAFTASPYFAHYNASKGALASFSETLRIELRKSGVSVVTVYPGPIDTPMAERNYKQFRNEALARRAPTGDAKTLARLVVRALDTNKPRVIYQSFYKLGWWLPGVARFVTSLAMPEVTGAVTPQ